MNDFNGLATRLKAKANKYHGFQTGKLLTEAATAISVQADRVAELEQQLEKQAVQIAELRLQLDYHERESRTVQRVD